MIEIFIGFIIMLSATYVVVVGMLMYVKRVIEPVAKEHQPINSACWSRFVDNYTRIQANIKSCLHPEQCFNCMEMIRLFNRKYRDIIHISLVERAVERLWEMLDERYKTIDEPRETSELSIDDLIN
ncbi:MAG: hypothetical protein H0W75_00670 [Chitinophagaceae bacterium]|nr:hypothetical protein [Chitinophagaceae bacterium]